MGHARRGAGVGKLQDHDRWRPARAVLEIEKTSFRFPGARSDSRVSFPDPTGPRASFSRTSGSSWSYFVVELRAESTAQS
jgi:hypothetical protein